MAVSRIVNAYEDGNGIVLVERRGDARVVHRQPAEWVSFYRAQDLSADLKRELAGAAAVRSVREDGPWVRVGWRDREVRKRMCGRESPITKRGIGSYEGDLDPVRRAIVDMKLQIDAPRRCYFDLETDSRVPFSRKQDARILSWSLTDERGNMASAILEEESDAAEVDLITALWEELLRFDQCCAWNLDGFDAPVLMARTDAHGLRFDPRMLLWVDHLQVYKKIQSQAAESGAEKQSYKLGAVARALKLGDKDDLDGSRTYEYWKAGGASRERLLTYNERDTELLRLIEAETGYVGVLDTLAQVCGVLPNTMGLRGSRYVDGFMLQIAASKGQRFPTKMWEREPLEEGKEEDEEKQFRGAYVMEPRFDGVASNVHVFDFTRLYPSIILTWNMSPETVVTPYLAEDQPVPAGAAFSPLTRVCFDPDKDGLLPFAVRMMIEQRKVYSKKKEQLAPGTPEWVQADRMDKTFKVIVNTFYGVVGMRHARFFAVEVAESIAQCGVMLIKETIKLAEERYGYTVGYCDTDSGFVSGPTETEFREFVRACNEELYPDLLRKLGCKENAIKLAYEKEFRTLVMCGKKAYFGSYEHYKGERATADSKPEVRGLEFRRGDAAKMAADLQEKLIGMVLAGERSREVFADVLDGVRAHVLEGELPLEEVVLTKSLSKRIDDYEQKTKLDGKPAAELAHVAVAKVLRERGLDIGEGGRVSYVVEDASDGIRAIPASDYDGTNADRHYLWENKIWPPAKRVLTAAFPDQNFDLYDRSRPRAPRTGRPVPEGQGAFDFGGGMHGTWTNQRR